MNIQLNKAIIDIARLTGMRIIRAILEGERDIVKLANMKYGCIRSSTNEIAKSLEGDIVLNTYLLCNSPLSSMIFIKNRSELLTNILKII